MSLFHEQEFWFAIAFVVFVGLAFRPMKMALTGSLDTRAAKHRTELEEARRLRAEAQALLDSFKAKQAEAVQSAADIVASAKDEAERMRQDGEAELKRSLAAREAQAMDRIAMAEQAAIQAVKARAVEVAIRAATGLVASTLDQNAANTLVEQAIDDLPKRAQG
jgi:F-type H+-transporting ATPase subunit b